MCKLANLLLSVGVCLLLAATTVPGQERFGELNGTATDPSGAILPNVSVAVKNKGTGRVVTTQTSSSGQYVVRNLEPGAYSVRFELLAAPPHEDGADQIIVERYARALERAVRRDPASFLWLQDRKSTRLNSSHLKLSRMPSSA